MSSLKEKYRQKIIEYSDNILFDLASIRLFTRKHIEGVIKELEISKSNLDRTLRQDILKLLKSHQNYQGGYETPFFKTINEISSWYGINPRTFYRWKKNIDFPHFEGELYDGYVIDRWLQRHDKVNEDFQILRKKMDSA